MAVYPKADVALLTSVPEEHLIAGYETSKATNFVVFGTNAALVLLELKELVDETHQADILFYASHAKTGGPPRVSYRGRFVDYADAKRISDNGDWRKYRPESTQSDTQWGGCYLVRDLHKVEPPVLIASLKRRGGSSKLAKGFIPIGPIIIDTPF